MVGFVVTVLAAFQKRAEFDRLVGFIMMHRPEIQAGQAEKEGRGQGREKQNAERGAFHLRMP